MEKELKAIAAEYLCEMYDNTSQNVHLYDYLEDDDNQLITTEEEYQQYLDLVQ